MKPTQISSMPRAQVEAGASNSLPSRVVCVSSCHCDGAEDWAASGSVGAATSPEALKKMNYSTAKFATWIVHVKDPKIIDYEFIARGEPVRTQKFQCVLVSQNPKEYVMGTVPFFSKQTGGAAGLPEIHCRFRWGSRDTGIRFQAET